MEDQDAGWEQSVPVNGCYNISLSNERAYKLNFGSSILSKPSSKPSKVSYEKSRLSRAPDEDDDAKEFQGKFLPDNMCCGPPHWWIE